MSSTDQSVAPGSVTHNPSPAKGKRHRITGNAIWVAVMVVSLGQLAATFFGSPEVKAWACVFSFAYFVVAGIAAVLFLLWYEKQKTLSWIEYTQTLSDDAERRFRNEQDRWSAEIARLRAESARKLAEAEALLAEPIDPPPPAANPADILHRLRDFDAHVTADVGPDGAVTVVLRPKSRPTANGAG